MLTAGKKALADGGITEDVMDELDKAKCGVLIGSAMGGMKVNLSSLWFAIHVYMILKKGEKNDLTKPLLNNFKFDSLQQGHIKKSVYYCLICWLCLLKDATSIILMT